MHSRTTFKFHPSFHCCSCSQNQMLLRACIVHVYWEYSEPEGSCCLLMAFWDLPLHCLLAIRKVLQRSEVFTDSSEHWATPLFSKPNLLQMSVTFPENHTCKVFSNVTGDWVPLWGAPFEKSLQELYFPETNCPSFLPPLGWLHVDLPKMRLLPSQGLLQILNLEISLKISIKIIAGKRIKMNCIWYLL